MRSPLVLVLVLSAALAAGSRPALAEVSFGPPDRILSPDFEPKAVLGDYLAAAGGNIVAQTMRAVLHVSGSTGDVLDADQSPGYADRGMVARPVAAVETRAGWRLIEGRPLEDGYDPVAGKYLYECGRVHVHDLGGVDGDDRVIFAPKKVAYAHFGAAVAAVGDDILVGAPGTEVNEAYLLDGETLQLIATYLNPNPGSGWQFGYAVAGMGSNAVIGVPNDSAVKWWSGAVHIFDA